MTIAAARIVDKTKIQTTQIDFAHVKTIITPHGSSRNCPLESIHLFRRFFIGLQIENNAAINVDVVQFKILVIFFRYT